MARYARTILKLDNVLSQVEIVARDLYVDGKKVEAGALRANAQSIREVRNNLLASDHDAEKARA